MELYNTILKTLALVICALFVFFFMKFTEAYVETNKYTYFQNTSPLRINNEKGYVGGLKMANGKLIFEEINVDSAKREESEIFNFH